MDNRLFNVNGKTKEQLALAVKLFLLKEYNDSTKVRGWYFSKEKGIILTWITEDSKSIKTHGNPYQAIPFTNRMGQPADVNAEELTDILWNWLSSEEAKTVEFSSWEQDADHDGENDKGWRLYTEDWGCITETGKSMDHYSIGAFKPVYLWYGK